MMTNGDPVSGDLGDFAFFAELERQRIDARGPEFEGLVDAVLRELRGDRDLLRIHMHQALWVFGERQALYHDFERGNPGRWLKRVNAAARELAALLENATADFRSTDVELADLDDRVGRETLLRLVSDVQRLVDATKDTVPKPKGRRSPHARRQLVGDLAELFQRMGRPPGRSTVEGEPAGPFFRIVSATYAVVGETQAKEAIATDIRMPSAKGDR